MIEVRPIDFASARDVDAYHALESELHTLVWPDNPPRSRDVLVREHETLPEFATVMRWVAWNGSEPVGVAHARWRGGVDNQHLATGYVGVLPEWRRQGIGTRLFHTVVTAARAAGRTSVIFDSDSLSGEGAAVLERLGGKKGIVVRISRLDVARLDADLMASWVRAGEARSDEFEILLWDDRVPPEHIESFAALHHVMNSAPLDDLDVEPFVLTPEQLIAYEQSRIARGVRWWCAVARHRESGEFAGFTDLHQPPHDPTIVYQGDTGVWHKYRRNGLGRWLKAVNALRVLRETPAAKWIETGNAGSNRAMLSINEAMGFYPYKHITAWQFDAAALEARTASSGVPTAVTAPASTGPRRRRSAR